ncbi:holo-ACP synthase [Undibacterium cyanobacteriorum]|uniref:Holo-[acyl-carrier-protein] synthase n=1 Tax=Undibacterium cyanobacteriorum TaxID=3073561 RepID=A0ABY9RCY5_9BURK|nr:holo-ACP synthase [Undibacterium sp. 20NA77.5]WMW79115.1 holo-ACP synthase [Undibacterium sp. 20NA77.5]
MIFGIGTDIVQTSRMHDAIARHQYRFADKILGVDEQLVFRMRYDNDPAKGERYLATRFAAKEALSKAMRTGFREPMSWHGVQLLNQDTGMPYFLFNETLSSWFGERGLVAHVSISDEKEYALAFVILETSAASLAMNEK